MTKIKYFLIIGQVIYPGKITDAESFRIGNIGHLFPEDMRKMIVCFKEVLTEMGVTTPVTY
jgi:2-aminoethylphosphonate-pyruvate transaminase